jgi:hypothetical protein
MDKNQSPISRARRLIAVIRRPWIRRTAAIVAALVVLFGLFGYLVLPGIIKSQAEKALAATLHRKLSIERVDVRPYALAVAIHGVKLYEADGQSVFFSLQEAQVRISASSLIHLAPVVKEVHLVAPFVHLARTGPNRYSTDDIVAALASQPAPAGSPAKGQKTQPRFSVYNIQVDGGRVEFDDQPKRAHHTVADLKLGIPFVSSLPSQEEVFVEPLLSAVINGAPLLIKGKARPFAPTPEAVVNLDLDQIDLPRYLEYLPFEPRFKMPEAKLDLHLHASFLQPRGASASVTLAGTATLKSLQLTALDGQPIVKLPEFVVELGKADLLAGLIDIARVAVTGLDLNVVKDPHGELNLGLLAPPPATQPAGQAPAAAAPEPAARAPEPAAPGPAIQVKVGQIALQGAAFRFIDQDPQRPLKASVEQLDLRIGNVALEPRDQRLAIGQIESAAARFRLQQGRSETDRAPLLEPVRAPTETAPHKPHPAAPTGPAASGSWGFSVGRIAIGNWDARIESRGLPQVAVTTVTGLGLSIDNLSSAAGSGPAKIDLKARVNRSGSISVAGAFGVAPPHADLALDLNGVDLLALQPYITAQVNVLVTQAELSSHARFALDQSPDGTLKGGFRGDVTLGHLATIDKLNGNDFLDWKSLSFAGVNVRLSPLSVDMDQIALSDFFARVIIDPTGRINLQDIMRSSPGERRSVTAEQTPGPAPVAPAAQGSAQPAASSEVVPIKVREVKLQGGRVRFTDNFIKPNYTANLLELAGSVTGLSSAADTTAAVDIHGEVNSAPLLIAGQVNPIKGDLFVDLKASVHGMELAPLSPYSGKYVGYGIERGKLSFDVAYKLEHRQLSAENRLVLDQLTFGDHIDSPTATKLPVQLAVALLKDRNGVIDVDLPIGGSLDDPQFSVGGVIVKVLVNLITKAVTAPFALLGKLFGGGEELSFIEYAPGSADVPAAGQSRLNSLAAALKERPGLKLEIGAWVDPGSDAEGLRHENLERRVRAMKVKDLVAKGESATVASVTVAPEEYPALLGRVYAAAQPAGSAAKEPPAPAEMEKQLLAATAIGDDELKALGDRRSQSVKTWLQASGQIEEQRLFLTATKVGGGAGAGSPGENTGQPATKTSRVEFALK